MLVACARGWKGAKNLSELAQGGVLFRAFPVRPCGTLSVGAVYLILPHKVDERPSTARSLTLTALPIVKRCFNDTSPEK
jgi:hypothetical protein